MRNYWISLTASALISRRASRERSSATDEIPSPLGLELALAQPHRDAKLERELP